MSISKGVFDMIFLRFFNELKIVEKDDKLYLDKQQLTGNDIAGYPINKDNILIDYKSILKDLYKVIDVETGELEKITEFSIDGKFLEENLNHYFHDFLRDYVENETKNVFIFGMTMKEFKDIYNLDFLKLHKEVMYSKLITLFNIIDINDKNIIQRYDPFFDTIILKNCFDILKIDIKTDEEIYEYKGLDVNHVYVEFKYRDKEVCTYDVPCVINANAVVNKLVNENVQIGDYLIYLYTHVLGTGNVCFNDEVHVIFEIDNVIKEILLLRLLEV